MSTIEESEGDEADIQEASPTNDAPVSTTEESEGGEADVQEASPTTDTPVSAATETGKKKRKKPRLRL